MSSVQYILNRTAARKSMGMIPVSYELNGKTHADVERNKYTILIGKCNLKPKCPYTWVLKFEGNEIERGEENTRAKALQEATNARTSHQTDNQAR